MSANNWPPQPRVSLNGFQAHEDGHPATANPYPPADPEHYAWTAGWCRAAAISMGALSVSIRCYWHWKGKVYVVLGVANAVPISPSGLVMNVGRQRFIVYHDLSDNSNVYGRVPSNFFGLAVHPQDDGSMLVHQRFVPVNGRGYGDISKWPEYKGEFKQVE